MTTILNEEDVTLETLREHIEEAGWETHSNKAMLLLRTPLGIGFSIRHDEARQFMIFDSCLPMKADYKHSLELIRRLNHEVFLAGFSIDTDGDLYISYAMSFEHGLILAQFHRITRRFSGLLEHVVSTFDKDGRIFNFEQTSGCIEEESARILQ